jgi:hypothetical protein
MDEDVPFDRVVITEGGERREMTVAQFVELPLDQRIHYILERTLVFYRGDVEIDRRVALAGIRHLHAKY